LLHAKASQLCAVVLKDIDTLKKNKEEIENLKRQKQSQLQQLQQVLHFFKLVNVTFNSFSELCYLI